VCVPFALRSRRNDENPNAYRLGCAQRTWARQNWSWGNPFARPQHLLTHLAKEAGWISAAGLDCCALWGAPDRSLWGAMRGPLARIAPPRSDVRVARLVRSHSQPGALDVDLLVDPLGPVTRPRPRNSSPTCKPWRSSRWLWESNMAGAWTFGYRHIDITQAFQNESGVGNGIRECGGEL